MNERTYSTMATRDELFKWIEAGCPDNVIAFLEELRRSAAQAEESDLGMVGHSGGELQSVTAFKSWLEEEDDDMRHMKTIVSSSSCVNGLAGTGYNTIRRFSEKYMRFFPGEDIRMVYESAEGETVGAEHLEVASIAVGSFFSLIGAHAARNHDELVRASRQALDYTVIADHFNELYGEDVSDDVFCAIYFK